MNHFPKALCVAWLLLSGIASGQVNTWIGPVTGDWNEPSNWSLGVVPNDSFTNVRIDYAVGQHSLVQIQSNQNFVSNELIIDVGDGLEISNAAEQRSQMLHNAGSIHLNATNSGSSQLLIEGTALNSPEGLIALDDATFSADAQLWNQGDIEGSGQILTPLIWNDQLIDANIQSETLIARGSRFDTNMPPSIANRGNLRASSGGWLRLDDWEGGVLQNLAGSMPGTIEAHGDSYVFIKDAKIVGGSITTSTTGGVQEGRIEFQNAISLVGVELNANASFWQGANLYDSDFANLGTIHFSAPGLSIAGDVRLAGGGTVLMQGNPRLTGGNTLYNQLPKLINVDNTFRAEGQTNARFGPGLFFENHGTIESVGQQAEINLIVASFNGLDRGIAAWQNRGVIRAIGGSHIAFRGSGVEHPFDNAGGVIEVDNDSVISFDQVHIYGGTLRGPASPGDGEFHFSGQANLKDVRLEGSVGFYQDTTLLGSIENTGQLRIEQILRFGGTEVVLTGGGEIATQSIERSFDQSTPIVKVINEDNTLVVDHFLSVGQGTRFVNRGTIEARDFNIFANLSLYDLPINLTNSGIIRAINGATLRVDNTTLNNYEIDSFGNVTPGKIQAGANSTLEIQAVMGGTLQAAAGGIIRVGHDGVLAGPAEAGELRLLGTIEASDIRELSGTIRNEGQFSISGTIGPFPNSVQLLGEGEMLLSGAQWPMINTSSLINGADHTITTNMGDALIQTNGNLLINEGRIEARDGRTMTITHDGSEFFLQQRGELIAQGGGQLRLLHPTGRLANDGLIESQLDSSVIVEFREQFTNRGIIQVSEGGQFDVYGGSDPTTRMLNTSQGEIIVDGQLTSPMIVNEQGGRISGAGQLGIANSMELADLVNHGILAPTNASGTSEFQDFFEIAGDYSQTESGILEIGIGGTNWDQYDKLLIDGVAELGGELSVSLFDIAGEQYTPTLGDSFQILETRGPAEHQIVGQFDTLSLPTLSDENSWVIRYSENAVQLLVVAPLLADLDEDNDVDGTDFLSIQRNSPALIPAWQSQYGALLGPIATSQAVPEPSTWLLGALCASCYPLLWPRHA